MFYKCKIDIFEIKKMLNKDRHGYCNYFKVLFGLSSYSVIEEDNKKNGLVCYLEKIVGRKLLKKEQLDLVKKVDIRRDGKLLKSYGSLNAYFLEDDIHFEIKSETDYAKRLEDGSKNSNYRKIFWKVYKSNTGFES